MAMSDPEHAVRVARRVVRGIALVFVAVMLFTTVRDLYTGVSRPYPGRRGTRTPPAASRAAERGRYWMNLGLNVASGLLMAGAFTGASFLIRPRKKV